MRRRRCTRQSALIAATNVKYHLSLTEQDQCTVESVIRREDPLDRDIKLS
jgi:hypothetical protein